MGHSLQKTNIYIANEDKWKSFKSRHCFVEMKSLNTQPMAIIYINLHPQKLIHLCIFLNMKIDNIVHKTGIKDWKCIPVKCGYNTFMMVVKFHLNLYIYILNLIAFNDIGLLRLNVSGEWLFLYLLLQTHFRIFGLNWTSTRCWI